MLRHFLYACNNINYIIRKTYIVININIFIPIPLGVIHFNES